MRTTNTTTGYSVSDIGLNGAVDFLAVLPDAYDSINDQSSQQRAKTTADITAIAFSVAAGLAATGYFPLSAMTIFAVKAGFALSNIIAIARLTIWK